MRFRFLSALLVAFVLAVVVAGCSPGSASSASPSAPTPTTGGTGTGTGSGGGSTPSVTITIVGINGASSFNPNPASAAQGSTLAWRNSDSVTHHIVFNDGSLDAGEIAPGATSAVLTLAANGANYHCTIHPTMVGSINQATGTPPPCDGVYC
jgi:plastocyanin